MAIPKAGVLALVLFVGAGFSFASFGASPADRSAPLDIIQPGDNHKKDVEPPGRNVIAPKTIAECERAADALPDTLRFYGGNETKDEEELEVAIWRFLCGRGHLRADQRKQLALRVPSQGVTGTFIKFLVASTFFDVPGYSEVDLEGLTVRGPVDLSHEILRGGLAIRNSTFNDKVNLSYLRSEYDLDFSASTFKEDIDARSMRVKGSVYFGMDFDPSRQDSEKTFELKSLDLSKSQINGEIRFRSVHAQNANFQNIKIDRLLQTVDSSFKSIVIADGELGQLEIVNCTITSPDAAADETDRPDGKVVADGISVDHNVFIDRTTIDELYISWGNIKSHLSLRGSAFTYVDLTGTKIGGDLRLGQAAFPSTKDGKEAPRTTWKKNNKNLSLEHAEVGLVRAALAAWPEPNPATSPTLLLNGFQFGGFDAPLPKSAGRECSGPAVESPFGAAAANLENGWHEIFGKAGSEKDNPPTCYYKKWLSNSLFAPSVYDWLQQSLKKAGNEQQSRAIGIMKKNREREEAWLDGRYWEWFVLALSGIFIGYGYYPWISAIWALAFIFIGALIFKTTSIAKRYESEDGYSAMEPRPFNSVLFSFDMLIPMIQLRKSHYDLDIPEPMQRRYFYFHRIMGYVLGLFLIGAISGLTK